LKIASNTPTAFHPKSGYEFVQLGDGVDDVSAVLLMLEKNWGSNFIDSIRALTYWVSSYPKEVPAFIVGCESTIPDLNLELYRHNERDDAIRALCDEVLGRSASIGVRGEITRAYLTQLLGFADNQVDVIYERGAPNNSDKLRRFLVKNGLPIGIENSLLDFQNDPYVPYEKPISPEKNITISHPYITTTGETARLSADVTIDGQIKTLWCETALSNSQYLLAERADAFLCALLPLAMRIGKDIICEAPVTDEFLHNLNEILIPQLSAHDSRLHRTIITAVGDCSSIPSGHAIGTGMSCGVDSFYTTSLYHDSPYGSMALTHLYCGNYLYGNNSPLYDRAQAAADDLSLPLVRTATNINEALHLPHVYTHFFKTMFGVLALRKLFRIYYYSTAEDFSHFDLKNNSVRDTALIELLLLYVFSCAEFRVITGGVKSERLEKTRAICDFPTARKFLNVCLHPGEKQNCGKCGKCLRTLLMLDMLEALDSFGSVFDVEEYRRSRAESFAYLVQEKHSIMLADVYRHFAKTEPLLVAEAEGMAGGGAR